MVRGCQRRVVHLKCKDTGLFSEAYFIVDEKAAAQHKSDGDMLREANRIINESLGENSGERRFFERLPRPVKIILKSLPPLVIGALLGALIGALIW